MLTVRFQEYEHYDINGDQRMTQFLATTSIGTYYAEVVVHGPRQRREMREAFKTVVLGKMQLGQPPCEIWLGEHA